MQLREMCIRDRLGYIPAAALVHILHLISHNEDISLLEAVIDTKKALLRLFADKTHLKDLILLIDRAVALANKNLDDLEAIRELGQGWVACLLYTSRCV